MRAISATDGNPLWSTPILPTPDLSTMIYHTPPVFANGRLFIVVDDGSLYALASDTGAVLWHAPVSDLTSKSQ